jgi:D-sedoheptulose 7-phosphate isomerase
MTIPVRHFFDQVARAADCLVGRDYHSLLKELVELRERRGRLFVVGVGGGAANASHAVNDFRKLCAIEAYAPTDSVAEITARANDEGWERMFAGWLESSNLTGDDALLVFSVGGGKDGVSMCISKAVEFARYREARVLGVVGRDDGTTAMRGHVVIVCQVEDRQLLTPVTETMQIAVLHALVSDPKLQVNETKW